MATTEKELTATGAKVTTVVTENEATAAAPDEPAAGKAGWIVVGGVDAALAGAKTAALTPVDCRGVGVPEPAFADDFAAFVKTCADSSQLFNTCKRGPCGKVCAATMTICNGCGGALPAETIQTNNVFMGFVHGVRNGPFPFKISLRAETEKMIVFDDKTVSDELSKGHTEIEKEARSMETAELEGLNKAFDEYILRQMRFKSEVIDEIAKYRRDRTD